MAQQFTQAERLIAVDTPLGADHLLLRSFSGTEAVSRLFLFQLDMLSEDFNVAFDDIIGQKVTVSIKLASGSSKRYFNGHVSRFTQLPGEDRLARYQADVVPWLWFLTRTADCRIFQNKTVPDIVQEIFQDHGFQDFEFNTQKQYEPWEYCVQYRETACSFVMRLLEQEGIFFFFRHQQGKHVMVLADTPSAHDPCPEAASVRYERVFGPGYDREEDVVLRWRYQQEYRTGKYALRDYNFETPHTDLTSTVDSRIDQGGNRAYEVFDYPGEYEKRNQGDVQVKLRIEEQELPHEVIRGDSNCRPFSAGFRFTLTDHERDDQNGPYVLTEVTHSGHSGSFHSRKAGQGASYSNSFACIPLAVPFRPLRVTAKHLVQGPQTAVVVGPAGEEIYTDKYGRVKVQFYWDRRGDHNEKSSCWVRVSQPWAGKGFGGVWHPRIGQEVIVDFLEGDPDRPIITGRVYNADQMPPYELPANQTQSGFKSRSSKGGAASNHNTLRFEDKKGSEQVFLHAEKDLDVRIKADRREWVGNRTSLIVEEQRREWIKDEDHGCVDKSRYEKVGLDCHLTIGGSHAISVDQKSSLTTGSDLALKVGSNHMEEVSNTYYLKAGTSVVIEAGSDLTLKAAGGFIKIDPSGVYVNGTMLMLNSGGAPGTAMMQGPDEPQAPKEPGEARNE
jgi:type VI secretion system secreted protein VgrG